MICKPAPLIQHCCFEVVGNSSYRCWCTGSWAGSSPSCRRGGEVTGLACHVCPALPGDGDGVGQRDHLSAVGLQEPRLLQQRLMCIFRQQQLVIRKVFETCTRMHFLIFSGLVISPFNMILVHSWQQFFSFFSMLSSFCAGCLIRLATL